MSNRDPILLDSFFENWNYYQGFLKTAIAPLTKEQFAFRASPAQRTLGEIVQHIIAARVWWFHSMLGEGDAQIAGYGEWDVTNAPARSAQELLRGLEVTWDLMQQLFDRWNAADLAVAFPCELDGTPHKLPRTWVIYHVLEHDLVHGGEVSLLLGMQGLPGLAI